MNSYKFQSYIQNYREALKKIFEDPENHKKLSLNRELDADVLNMVMKYSPLNIFIPEEYNGMGGSTSQCLTTLEASSYESLPLSLLIGINGALFIQPVARYAEKNTQKNILNRFSSEKSMGGLMITEPDFGSDALHMQTFFRKKNKGYHVKGVKHWAGLTGAADYWLLTAREMSDDGKLGRDVGFFIHDSRNSGIEVAEYFNNLGLYLLPYGRNDINTWVPEDHRLRSPSTGIKLMLDMLHRSRLQFPGMAMGFLKRIVDDALHHVKSRQVGGRPLLEYDQVKERIVRLQSYFTTCSAMCAFTSRHAPISKDLSGMDVPANAIKSVITDMMHEAAQSLLQLTGAQGYRLDHMAGRNIVDSRPFQIFEGSNDILYQQISESMIKKMRRTKVSSLKEFLINNELTEKAADYVAGYMDFTLKQNLSQRKLVELGRILGFTISLDMVLRLGERGFKADLINNTIETLKNDIKRSLVFVTDSVDRSPLDELENDTGWLNYTD